MRAVSWFTLAWTSLTAIACSTVVAQNRSGPPPYQLTVVGEITAKGDSIGSMYLADDGKVYATSYRGTWRWLGGPSVRLVDAKDGKELRKREIKVQGCLEDHTINLRIVPNSTDLLAEAGCGHLLVLDGNTLATKRELTADVPAGEKLWSSSFIIAPDGKHVKLTVTYETKKATRRTVMVLRTSDWQEESSSAFVVAEHDSSHSSFSADSLNISPDSGRKWVTIPDFAAMPTVTIRSTGTGEVLVRSDALSFSADERHAAEHDYFLGERVGIRPSCQISRDGNYVMLHVLFGNTVARARVYRVM
jgi:hypothetical protein